MPFYGKPAAFLTAKILLRSEVYRFRSRPAFIAVIGKTDNNMTAISERHGLCIKHPHCISHSLINILCLFLIQTSLYGNCNNVLFGRLYAVVD